MHSAYHSPGKGLQQHSVLMLDTQINLRPTLTALLSSSRTYLVALKHGHLDLENCLCFFSQDDCLFGLNIIIHIVEILALLKVFVVISFYKRIQGILGTL